MRDLAYRPIPVLKKLLLVPVTIIAGIIASPIILVIYSILYVRRKLFDRKYKAYLKTLEGRTFFCYNNRKDSLDFIEKRIIPQLPKDIDLIFLNGRQVVSDFDPVFISTMLYRLKHYQKFPHLVKIVNGEVIDQSINNVFYNILNQDKQINLLLEQIENFTHK